MVSCTGHKVKYETTFAILLVQKDKEVKFPAPIPTFLGGNDRENDQLDFTHIVDIGI